LGVRRWRIVDGACSILEAFEWRIFQKTVLSLSLIKRENPERTKTKFLKSSKG